MHRESGIGQHCHSWVAGNGHQGNYLKHKGMMGLWLLWLLPGAARNDTAALKAQETRVGWLAANQRSSSASALTPSTIAIATQGCHASLALLSHPAPGALLRLSSQPLHELQVAALHALNPIRLILLTSP